MRDPEDVYYTLKSLVLELDRREAEENLAMLLFAQLLIRIARLRAEAENKSPFGANPHVRKTVDFLYQNYDRPIQVKDIAAAANVHPGYLHRIFKAQTGQTLTEYLTALRMEKAKMLLLIFAIMWASAAGRIFIPSSKNIRT